MRQISKVDKIDEAPFNSDASSVFHYPDKFILNFIAVYPLMDKEQIKEISCHKIVTMAPSIFKAFVEALVTNLKNYENKYGEIKPSESLKLAMKEMEKQLKEGSKSTTKPDYFG